MTPAERVRAAAQALGADDAVTASALAALARRQATAGKTCARCATPKRHAELGVDSSTFDGLNDSCKVCRAETQRRQRREGLQQSFE